MEVDRKADPLLLLLREHGVLVGSADAHETCLHVAQLILHRAHMLQRTAVDRAHRIEDVLCVARLARGFFQPLCDVVDHIVGRLAAVDHGDDLHLDLLLPAVRLANQILCIRHQITFSPW